MKEETKQLVLEYVFKHYAKMFGSQQPIIKEFDNHFQISKLDVLTEQELEDQDTVLIVNFQVKTNTMKREYYQWHMQAKIQVVLNSF